MAYADQITARADASLVAKIDAALLRRAWARAGQLAAQEDQRESTVNRTILDGADPASWTHTVIDRLDSVSALPSPTDAQIDTAVISAVARLIVTRS